MCVRIYMHVIISTNITDTVTIYLFFTAQDRFCIGISSHEKVQFYHRFFFTVSTNAVYTSIYDTKTSPH